MYIEFKIQWGEILMMVDEDALVGLWFKGQKHFPDLKEDTVVEKVEDLDKKKQAFVVEIMNQLKAFEEGTLSEFNIKLAPNGTEFQKLVWQCLLEIPFGNTRTYGDIAKQVAKKMGRRSMSAQAVGGAVGHNPISVIVPCHRVLGAKGQMTGYAGGIDKKLALLKHEGAIE